MRKAGRQGNVSLEDSLLLILEKSRHEILSMRGILEILAGRGRLILICILSLPFCLPVTVPGLSTPFGFVIAILGFQWTFKTRIALPAFILNHEIHSHHLETIVTHGLQLINRIRPYIHPRILPFGQNPYFRTLCGNVIIALAILLAFPLPIPFTNMIFALPIFIMSLGLLEDDGLLLLISVFIFSLYTVIFIYLISFIFIK